MKKITAAPRREYWSLLCPVTAGLIFSDRCVFMVIAFIVIAFIILLHRPQKCTRHHTNLHQQYHRYTNCKSGFSGFVVKKSHAKDRPDAATDDST